MYNKDMTKEQNRINIKNNKKAREYFKAQPGWVLHHINPDWRENDIERYIQWNPEDLIMMTRSEHNKWHMNHDKKFRNKINSLEANKKISEAKKGIHRSEDTKRKLSEYWTGKKRPEQYIPGRQYYFEHKELWTISSREAAKICNTSKTSILRWRKENV